MSCSGSGSSGSGSSGSGSEFSREVQLATALLCGSSGSMPLLQLHRELLQRCEITEEEFCWVLQGCPRFLLVSRPAEDGWLRPEDCTVVARTSLRLCGRQEECGGCGGGSGGCEQLHLCKFFIYGNCRFGKGRKPCKFSHDIHSDHNLALLRECTLHELTEEQLSVLLLQNDNTLLPEVCVHYNRGDGPHGACSFQDDCTKVHLCQHFVRGDCIFGLGCKRQHAIDKHGCRMLEERGLGGDIINQLPFIYRNIHHLAAAEKCPDSSYEAADQQPEICLHFIRDSCRFQNGCRRVHFPLPYLWEVFDGVAWTALQDMEDIERDYCDPSKTQSSGDRPVDFLSWTRDSQAVRRLSTVSSVTKPPHYVLTTDWLWYYRAERGNWVEYGQPDDRQRTTSVTSRTLEEAFLADRTAEVRVVKDQRQYVVSFKDMYQRNPKHRTKRRVCRRPRFVSVAEVTNR
ncbi:protein mono-ADP-ribosyltransferase PARP12b isoform X2 [Sander lucioperca]|uniref:Poly (ADP-ribose) polymerase family, member 12b n=1 Tax=Sander lucioperca TaxID=283035 RepID=A0A8D0AAP7_SANLU|nr:protein mono-ADP-ribosyltransferase PARP12b isoform X2 [Sander lucioperca]